MFQDIENEITSTNRGDTWGGATSPEEPLPSLPQQQQRRPINNWCEDTEEFEPFEETLGIMSNVKLLEEAKKKREERKLLRQKEMEARRANRNAITSGPMKLGTKKMQKETSIHPMKREENHQTKHQ